MKPPLFACLAFLFFLLPTAHAESPASFRQIGEVVSNWSPQQHLWVDGNLGIPSQKLSELETWLDQNGSNWTIVLMQNASGESFEGRRGMTAVEFALGQGLSNQTGFGELTDKRTGEKNGAVFVLFLQERKFSYFASEAYDKRSLGERHWIGRLDRPAIQAMRSGGRIVDAVQNTVSNIESSLTRKIKEEEERKRLAEIERQRALDEARTYPAKLDELIAAAVERSTNLQESAGKIIDGPVFQPNVSAWKSDEQMVANLVEIGSISEARHKFTETRSLIESFQTGLDNWEAAPARFESLEGRLSSHPRPEKAPRVIGSLTTAAEGLASARANHEAGEPIYLAQVNEAEQAFSQAVDSYDRWVEAERRKRLTLQAIAVLSALAVLIFLVVANRLRRPAREEATSLWKEWQGRLQGKFDELFALVDRTSLVVGSSSDLDERGFTGTTESLARQTIRGVDELFIMSAATDEVMGEVEGLIEPRSLASRLFNRFSSRNYRKATALLTSEPIGFDETDHLEAILHPEKSEDRSRSLLGKAEDYEPFRISFESLVAEYDARQAIAKDGIGRLESGVDGFPLRHQALSDLIAKTAEEAESFSRAGAEDTLFPLVHLRQDLIPASLDALDTAARLGDTDPVEAFESHLPECERLVTESRAMTDTIEAFRSIDLPVLQRGVERLNEKGRQTAWVDDALSELTATSEQLATRAATTAVSDEWATFDDDLTRLKGRLQGCEALTQRIEEELEPLIETRSGEIAAARAELSRQLNLPESEILAEPGLSPDERVALARSGITAAVDAINKGRATAAQGELSQVESNLEEAGGLVALSRECASEHARIHDEMSQKRADLLAEIPEVSALLEELQSGYASSVLLFSSRFGEEIDGQQSVVESIERAERRLAQAETELEQSRNEFETGSLIHAYGLLEAIANELGFAHHQLSLVKDQHGALKEAERENRKRAESLASRHKELSVRIEDRRTCEATISSHASAGEEITRFQSELDGPESDPFVLSRDGIALSGRLNSIEDGIEADWRAHEIAESAATGAKAALTFCHTFLREAQTDKIPDSRALTRAIQRHGELSGELERIETALEGNHADWNELFGQVNDLSGETAKVRATLERELAAARDAAEQLRLASRAISDLHKWRSSHSVTIRRNAGSKALHEARQALALGNYGEARKAAIASRGAALREHQRAKTKEARAEAKAAAARRAAMFSSSSSSSFGSTSSFGSSFSSGSSGFSSSSFSSGSGFSRSGW